MNNIIIPFSFELIFNPKTGYRLEFKISTKDLGVEQFEALCLGDLEFNIKETIQQLSEKYKNKGLQFKDVSPK